MSEVITDEKKLRSKREATRSNSEQLLEVLMELFPTWGWQAILGESYATLNIDTRVHFLHNNPLHSEFSDDTLCDKELLHKMFYHSVEFQCAFACMLTSDEDQDGASFPRLYYNLEGVEQLLVTYRAWVRLNSSDSEYERINSLVTSCFV